MRYGEVFFVHTGQGLCKIEAHGRLTYLHKIPEGLGWLWTPRESLLLRRQPVIPEELPCQARSRYSFLPRGAPLVVNRDGTLLWSGFPGGEDTTPGPYVNPDVAGRKKDPVRTGLKTNTLRSWAKRSPGWRSIGMGLCLCLPQCDPEGQDDGDGDDAHPSRGGERLPSSIQRSLVHAFFMLLSERFGRR